MQRRSQKRWWVLAVAVVSWCGLSGAPGRSAAQPQQQNSQYAVEQCQQELRLRIEREQGRRSRVDFARAETYFVSNAEEGVRGTATLRGERDRRAPQLISYNCTVNIRNGRVREATYTAAAEGNNPGRPINLDTPLVEYSVHVADRGWIGWAKDGETSGGEGRRMEAIRIAVPGLPGTVRYRAHIQDHGWQDWIKEGRMAGTTGQSRRMEAIQIELRDAPGWSIQYSVYVSDLGWSEWVRDGEAAGTTGQSRAIEGIKIRAARR